MGIESRAATASGACLCGAVRFTVRLPTLFCGHCHCTMCQRGHGAAYVTWFGVVRDQFVIDAGEDSLVRYPSSDHGTRSFCGVCGSSMFCESTREPDTIDVVLANMTGAIDLAPQGHTYFSDRASWVAVDEKLPRLGGPTGMEPL